MKKTLAALAVLGAFAGSAAAADVTLYGVVDYGFLYKHSESTEAKSGDTTKTDSLTLDSGVDSASRFGLKGTEDLGNGMKVGFKLENGFSADDGTLSQNGRLLAVKLPSRSIPISVRSLSAAWVRSALPPAPMTRSS